MSSSETNKEDRIKYVWGLNNNTVAIDIKKSTNLPPDDKNRLFKFEVTRQVDLDEKESVIIRAFYIKNQPYESYGKIETNIQNIQQDMVDFRQNGVALTRATLIDIARTIEDNYLDLPRVKRYDLTKKKSIDEVFKVICQYIRETGIKTETINSVDLYNIPVDEFREFVSNNSELSQWDYANIKKELSLKHYTKCNTGRTDNTISLKSNDLLGKRVKVISIFANKVDEI